MGLFDRFIRVNQSQNIIKQTPQSRSALIYSWVETNKFAIGPMPRHRSQWEQLEKAGFRSRFSCCYEEEQIVSPPMHWQEAAVALPDHRQQETMKSERLKEALIQAEKLIKTYPATYLHCYAGRERSALLAVGLIARKKNIDVLAALDFVRLCHPLAAPIYSDLDILDQLIKAQAF